jgi:pimeloyl-ACP methyl ester carboxylesterase
MPTNTRKGYVDGPFGQIHYQQAGELGHPIIVLCHQSPSSSEMFRAAYHPLAEHGLQVIGIDTPGFGMSDVPDHPPSIEEYAAAIGACIGTLSTAPVTLLGHHTGAAIAAELAVAAPNQVERLILNGPPVMTAEEREQYSQALKDAPPVEPQADGSHLTAMWERRQYFTPGWTSLSAMHLGVIQMFIAGETDWYGHRAAFAHDIAVPLGKVQQPTLILTNTGDDIYYAAARARALRPDFHYTELAGGTHDIVDEQPGAWSQVVANFALGKD